MAVTRFGLTLEAQTRGEEQLRRFEAQVNSLYGKLDQLAKSSEATPENINKLAGAMGRLNSAANQAPVGKVQSLFGAFVKADLAVSAIERLGGAMRSLTIDTAKYAASTQLYTLAARSIAMSNGVAVQSVDRLMASLSRMGITRQDAAQGISQSITSRIGTGPVSALARMGQDLAVTNPSISSSDAFTRIMYGIQSAQIEVLRTVGLNVNFEQAYSKFAQTNKRTIDSLSEVEKTQIRTNAVLQQGARYSGLYEESLGTVGKQMQSLDRLTKEASSAIGENFLPALSAIVRGSSALLDVIAKSPRAAAAVGYGGALAAGAGSGAVFGGMIGGPKGAAIGAAIAGTVSLGTLAITQSDAMTMLSREVERSGTIMERLRRMNDEAYRAQREGIRISDLDVVPTGLSRMNRQSQSMMRQMGPQALEEEARLNAEADKRAEELAKRIADAKQKIDAAILRYGGGDDPVTKLLRERNELAASAATLAQATLVNNLFGAEIARILPSAQRSGAAAQMIRPGVQRFQGPSLLREGETANRGAFGLDPALVASQRQQQLETERQLNDFQVRQVELIAGPGGELAAIQQATQMRLDSLDRQAALTNDLIDLDKQRLQVTLDGELRILELQRRRQEQLRADGAAIFDSITASGGGGLRRYVTGLGMGIGRTMFGNVYGELMGGMQGRLALPGQGEPGKPNLLGRILQGTPFGMDPMKTATDLNTAATQQNTAAITQLSGAVTSTATIGGAAGVPGAPAGTVAAAGGMGNLTRALGIGGSIAGGAFGIFSGIKQGGARGTLTGIGAAGGAMAGLSAFLPAMGAAGPIGAAVAMGAMMAASFLPDPKESRRKGLEEELARRRVDDPVGTSYTADIYGRSVDYDRRGETRIYIDVKAMDSQSFVDHAEDIGEAVRVAFDRLPTLAPAARQAILGTA